MGNCFKRCSRQGKQDKVSRTKKNSTADSQTSVRCCAQNLKDIRWPSIVLTTTETSVEFSGEKTDKELSAVLGVKADAANTTKSTGRKESWLSTLRAKTKPDAALKSSLDSQLSNETEDGKLRSHPSMAWSYHCSRQARSLQVYELEDEVSEQAGLLQAEPNATPEITEQPTNSYDEGRGMLELLKVRVDIAANNMEINSILKRLDEISDRTRKRLQNLKRRLNVVASVEPASNESTLPCKPRICWE